jgi:hypothetical protein
MKVWFFVQIMIVLTGILHALTVMASDQKSKNLKEFQDLTTTKITQSRVYTHPVSGFTIAVPPGAQLSVRDEKNPQISIRSRKGYRVSIQSGVARPEILLKDMLLILEAKYLGKGKPWSQKEKQELNQISDLPAIKSSYRGSNMRSRVDIIRGRKTDHVFIFFAAEQEYQSLEHEYVWMLANFKPSLDDILKTKVDLEPNALVFEKPGYGYSIRYPKDWVYVMPSKMTAVFSGAEGSAAYSAVVSVQNISPPQVETSEDAARAVLSELKLVLQKSVLSLKVRYDKPWDYVRKPFRLNGRELIFSYSHEGQKFFKKIIIVPRPFRKLAHIWSYTAPVEIFDTYRETANKILLSWTILATN